MIEVINKNWLDLFLAELHETNSIYLISPFVTRNIVDHLLNNGSAHITLQHLHSIIMANFKKNILL